MQIIRKKNSFTITDFKIVPKYKYKSYSRNDEKIRTYNVEGEKIPSVTTIISATQSEEKRKSLCDWRKRVGEAEATKITIDAARRGTEMHLVLEKYCQGLPYLNTTIQGNISRLMAHVIVDHLEKLKEVWGSEVNLIYKDFCPSLYPNPKKMAWAGLTDLVGLYDDKPTIIDFKQANKLKKEEWIEDYYYQIAAYSIAHKAYYGEIEQGLICICTKNYQYQSFLMDYNKLLEYENKWMERAYEYYKKLSTISPKT
tara:strand:+ start:1510 stop:2274 length:765 start_codon:yes stop_codon:yes gene_type:complete